MGDLLGGYQPVRAWDEMFEGVDRPRAHYAALHTVLGTLSCDDFELRCAARDRAFRDQGITFQLSGEEERPFPLDLVPRIIDADECDYTDVAPLKGIYQGGPSHTMAVTVEITRVA